MQGLADGYFVLPYTHRALSGRRGARQGGQPITPAFKEAEAEVAAATETPARIKGKRTGASFHRELGKLMWDDCGMARNEAGLKRRHARRSRRCAKSSGRTSPCLGNGDDLNQALEYAGRVADFLEFGELLCLDALHRDESCGGHFREEYQTPEGEAKRDDEQFAMSPPGNTPGRQDADLHKEPLVFETVKPRRGATSNEVHAARLAAEKPAATGPDGHATRRTTSRRTCRSWRCSTCSTRS